MPAPSALAGSRTATFSPVRAVRSLLVFPLALGLLASCGGADAPTLSALMPPSGPTEGGTIVVLRGADFREGSVVLFDDLAASDVELVSEEVITAVTPAHAAGAVSVAVLGPSGGRAELVDAYEYRLARSDEGSPRLLGAVSVGNTLVRLSFSEPMAPEGPAEPSNYEVVSVDGRGGLLVQSGELADDGLTATLTTRSQSSSEYELRAQELLDVDGNPLAPVGEGDVAHFFGTPATGEDLVDTDGDGLSDDVEQRGWNVTVELTNGELVHELVTSDPRLLDTDGDGLSDDRELLAGSSPRAPDTDGDGVDDLEEVERWRSDPTDQDSDGDGLADSVDLEFGTSPILGDTDGDGEDDRRELLELGRDPLIANLPRPQIVVNDFSLELGIVSSFTDESGATHRVSQSATTTVGQTRTNSLSRSDTRSTQTTNRASGTLGIEVSYGGDDGWGGKVTSSATLEHSRARGYSSTTNRVTAAESQESYDRTVSSALEESERREVTRTIESALLQASVDIANESEVPFTMTNIEVTVLRQDRAGDGSFQPVATLSPASDPGASFSLGPLDSERGPIIFQNTAIFPNLAEELLREPTGLIFEVANFDLLDEEGRVFAFSSATVNDRTAGLTIDYGDGRVEQYRIATHAPYEADGRPPGISMERALELAGLSITAEDAPVTDPEAPGVTGSVGTLRDAEGVQRLVRVRGVQNDIDGGTAQKRFWTIRTNDTSLAEATDFTAIQLRPRTDFLLIYTRDVDEDGLFEREENLYGSSDLAADSDSDGLLDFEEVRHGWTVRPIPGLARQVFSSPARPDSDIDGLDDFEERSAATDPNREDTDMDGLGDREELRESVLLFLFDGDADDSNNPRLELVAYSDHAIIDGGDGLVATTAMGDDVQVVAFGGAVAPGDIVVAAGENGVIDTVPAGDELATLSENVASGPDGICDTTASGDDIQAVGVGGSASAGDVCVRGGLDGVLDTAPAGDDFRRAIHDGLFVTDPNRRDTDLDGIPDGRELLLGINPNSADAGTVLDSDVDGLYDREELLGWDVVVDGVTRHVTSGVHAADTDLDGVPDVYEWAIGSDPRHRDTDGDGLGDGDELDPEDADRYYDPAAMATARRRCARALACVAPPTRDIDVRFRTSPVTTDSDGDGRTDPDELHVPWTVAPFRESPRAVYSLAYDADADHDGLDDAAELLLATDPNLADTDGDLCSDGCELTRVAGASHTDPLHRDRRVTLRLPASITVLYDCEFSSGGAEFGGRLTFIPPGAGTTTTTYDLSGCDGVHEGSDCAAGVAQVFILREEDYFSYGSTRLYETEAPDPSSSVGSDEELGILPEETFTYATVGTRLDVHDLIDTSTQGGLLTPEGECHVRLRVGISVD